MSDRSPEVPARREPDFSGGGGFGWPIVCHLAASMTITRHRGGGKTIRALIPIDHTMSC